MDDTVRSVVPVLSGILQCNLRVRLVGERPSTRPIRSGVPTTTRSFYFLVDFARNYHLRIAGSRYRRKIIHRLSSYSNGDVTRKETDDNLVRTQRTKCKVFSGLEFHSDHRSVVATVALRFNKPTTSDKLVKRFDVRTLDSAGACASLLITHTGLAATHHDSCASVGESRNTLREVTCNAAAEVLGKRYATRLTWLSQAKLNDVIEHRLAPRLSGNVDEYRRLDSSSVGPCTVSTRCGSAT